MMTGHTAVEIADQMAFGQWAYSNDYKCTETAPHDCTFLPSYEACRLWEGIDSTECATCTTVIYVSAAHSPAWTYLRASVYKGRHTL
jgi:hypothetical protein